MSDQLTIGQRVRPRNRRAPFDPESLIGTVIGVTPKGAFVYVRMRDGSVTRWRSYQVEAVAG